MNNDMSNARPVGRQSFASGLLEGWRRLFVNRSQPYAVQQADGTYRWRQEACDLEVLAGHLAGAHTLALSATDARDWCKWVCLDADAADALPLVVALARWLATDGLPGVLEASRRGGHLWLFLTEAVPAPVARYAVYEALDRAALAGVALPDLEVYPDRDTADGLGHAMRLPLGIHRRTAQRYPLLDPAGRSLPGTLLELATALLERAPRVSPRLVRARWDQFAAAGQAPASAASPASLHRSSQTGLSHAGTSLLPMTDATNADACSSLARSTSSTGSIGSTRSGVIRWVDAHVSPLLVLDELAPTCASHRSGAGYIAWCPFHDDRAPDADGCPGSPSLYVVQNVRYGWLWRCLSSNCVQHDGPMRHTFRLFQELLCLDVAAAIRAAAVRWPEALATAAESAHEPV
jgi:hypothetical protein